MTGGFRFIVEELFTLPGRGVVATGRVQSGSIAAGTEVGFLATNGEWVSALVAGIEVSQRLVEEAKTGERASLLLDGVRKEQLTTETILMDVPTAPAPMAMGGPEPPAPGAPHPPASGRPIEPSSGLWRTLLIALLGIFILLVLSYLGRSG